MANNKYQAPCSVCFRTHKLYASGKIVRHGFSIIGRENGQFGNAWHTGPCGGTSFPHFGLSTEGTEWALASVRTYLEGRVARLAELNARPTLTWTPNKWDARSGLTAQTIEPGAKENGCAKFVDFVDGYTGNKYGNFRLPSYEAVLSQRIANVEASITGAKADIELYTTAIRDWAPKAAELVSKPVKMHKHSTNRKGTPAPLCKVAARLLPVTFESTDIDADVNCKSCLRSLETERKDAEKTAKRIERALSMKKDAGRKYLAVAARPGNAEGIHCQSNERTTVQRLIDAGLLKRVRENHNVRFVITATGRAALA